MLLETMYIGVMTCKCGDDVHTRALFWKKGVLAHCIEEVVYSAGRS
jgi:hypothetical protein